MKDSTVRRLSSLHRVLYRTTAGVMGRRLAGNDMLLLTTKGRRTGRPHTVPLLYLRDGSRLVVIASYGGRDHHPDWYLNLVDDPMVRVQTRSRKLTARARTADPEEHSVWWPRIVQAYGPYAGYQARTERKIPVVFLNPAAEQRGTEVDRRE